MYVCRYLIKNYDHCWNIKTLTALSKNSNQCDYSIREYREVGALASNALWWMCCSCTNYKGHKLN